MANRIGLVCIALLLAASAACTSPADPRSASKDQEPAEESFDPPPEVAPKKVKDPPSFGQMRRCLRDKVGIQQLAGRYYGPTDLIAGQVRESRELPLDMPDYRFLNKKDFRSAVKAATIRYTKKQKRINNLTEWALGVRPRGSDGSSAEPGEVADLVEGFYVPRKGTIGVRQRGELDQEYIILAHELGHAMIDQSFSIRTDRKRAPLVLEDRLLARTALLEGDATLVELRVASVLSGKKVMKKAVDAILKGKGFKRTKGLPHLTADHLIFPYSWGLAFVCRVFAARGWKGVNRLHRRPPPSTAEIMFPERYLKGQRPAKPPSLEEPGRGWRLLHEGTVGPAHLKALFEAPNDKKTVALGRPLARAASWNGGTSVLWAQRGNLLDGVLGISLAEHPKHEGVLCSSMLKWYESRMNHNTETEVIADGTVSFVDHARAAIVSCGEGGVRFVIGPEKELARRVLGL